MFKIYSCIFYTCTSVFIVCTNQCVSEIPRVLSKKVVVYFEAYGTEVQYGKNCCCLGVTLTKRMYLP